MLRIDPNFERISRRLTALELRRADPDEATLDPRRGSPFGRVTNRFVQTYSAAGLQTVIHEFGLDDKLKAQGLTDFELRISDEDPFRHRLELVIPEAAMPGVGPQDRVIMDMHLHLTSVALPRVAQHANVVMVEWLLMQNPKRHFTRERPRLPGQRHPGTGMGQVVAQLLVLMCRRIGRDGLITVPERFHLDELYARGGWISVSPEPERVLQGVKAATEGLSLAARAWAVERGFITDEEGLPVRYVPHERVLPVEERLQKALQPGGFLWLSRLIEPAPHFQLDLDGLKRSLRNDPIEGMDPENLGG